MKKIKREKIYNFRVSEDELQKIREIAREYELPTLFRKWIQEFYEKHHQDPDDQVYKL